MRQATGTITLLAAALVPAACGSVEEDAGAPARTAAPGESAAIPAEAAAPAAPAAQVTETPPAEATAPTAPTTPAAAVADAAPDFTLPGVDGRSYSLAEFRGKVVVLEWTSHGCPFVRKHYDAGNMQRLQETYGARGVVWLSVCSSGPGKEGYMGVEAWRRKNEEVGTKARAVLLDPDGKVGRLFGAKTTPHMFVVGADGGILYRGAIDDRRSANPADIPDARNFVAEVLDAVLAGKAPPVSETRPYG